MCVVRTFLTWAVKCFAWICHVLSVDRWCSGAYVNHKSGSASLRSACWHAHQYEWFSYASAILGFPPLPVDGMFFAWLGAQWSPKSASALSDGQVRPGLFPLLLSQSGISYLRVFLGFFFTGRKLKLIYNDFPAVLEFLTSDCIYGESDKERSLLL